MVLGFYTKDGKKRPITAHKTSRRILTANNAEYDDRRNSEREEDEMGEEEEENEQGLEEERAWDVWNNQPSIDQNWPERYKQFAHDMNKSGIPWEVYHGRNFYVGPAARCDEIGDVMSRTSAKCQWDRMGLGYIVYPR